MKNLFLISVAIVSMTFGAAQVEAKSKKPIKPDQLEQCGAFVRTAPWCNESLEVDTRQLSAVQIIPIALSPEREKEWVKLHREKRRGIGYTEVNEKGEKVKAGRPVLNAVARVIGIPPSGDPRKAMLYQALVTPDSKSVLVLLPAGDNFSGWSLYILSSEGKHALTLSGELVKLSGRHRKRGNLSLDLAVLPPSQATSTFLATRGDGSETIEALETTFVDHKLVNDRNGKSRVYSGFRGTFTPISDDGTSVVSMYSNCRTGGQRLVEKGNLRIDTTTIMSAAATSGIGLLPVVIQNALALFKTSCR